jgi:hypothetical protein
MEHLADPGDADGAAVRRGHQSILRQWLTNSWVRFQPIQNLGGALSSPLASTLGATSAGRQIKSMTAWMPQELPSKKPATIVNAELIYVPSVPFAPKEH